MIPNIGCDPDRNIVKLGSVILEELKRKNLTTQEALLILPRRLDVSIDHIILTLDWLYAIESISIKDEEIAINAAKQT